MYTATKRLYRSTDGRIVDEGDPEAAFLVAADGSKLSADEARRYGLVDADGNEITPQETAADEADANAPVTVRRGRKGAKSPAQPAEPIETDSASPEGADAAGSAAEGQGGASEDGGEGTRPSGENPPAVHPSI